MNIKRIKFPIKIIILSIFLYHFYTEAYGQDKEKIILEWADDFFFETTETEQLRKLVGNVKLRQGKISVTCDRAIQNLDKNNANLIGNVKIYQDDMVLSSPEIFYDGNTGIATSEKDLKIVDKKTVLTAEKGKYFTNTLIADFNENVLIEDDSVKIYADRIVYYRKSGNREAYGKVLVKGKAIDAILACDTVFSSVNPRKTVATGSPVLFKIDTIYKSVIEVKDSAEYEIVGDKFRRFDTLSLSSDTIISFKNSTNEYYDFRQNVEIVGMGLASRSAFSFYDRRDNFLELTGSPIIWYDSTQLYSDSTVIYFSGERPDSIIAHRTAFAGTRNDTADINKIDQLSGDLIKILFRNDSLFAINSFGNSKSLYYLLNDEGTEGAARNGAEIILIEFDEGKPVFIDWLTAVEGEFIPNKLILMNPKSYNLPAYKWTEERPKGKILRLDENNRYKVVENYK